MTEPGFIGWTFTSNEPIGDGPCVVAVDPGLATGVAVLGPDGTVIGYEGEWYASMVFISNALHKIVAAGAPCELVSEAFNITVETAKKSPAPWSLEGIGVCRYLATRYGVPITLQQPVEAKKFATSKRLKHQGWYKSTPGGHVNDGLRHLYLRLAKTDRLVPPQGVV